MEPVTLEYKKALGRAARPLSDFFLYAFLLDLIGLPAIQIQIQIQIVGVNQEVDRSSWLMTQ